MNIDWKNYFIPKTKKYQIPTPELVWPEGVPGLKKGTPDLEEKYDVSQTVVPGVYSFNVRKITYPAFIPFPASKKHNTGKAVVICPGGGYVGVSHDKEGCNIARFLNEKGISAFVLKYRDPAPNDENGKYPTGPLSDALRTMRIVRSRAKQYGIDPNKIGIMGFSSGGHLCCTASTLYKKLKDPDKKLNQISARPDFTIAIYPVVSLVATYQHRGSAIRLLGGEAPMEKLLEFSPEYQVTKNTPPAFLVHAGDDTGVPLENSLAYFTALRAKGIPTEMHIFPYGGHGFGSSRTKSTTDGWMGLLANWLKMI